LFECSRHSDLRRGSRRLDLYRPLARAQNARAR